MGKRVGAAAPDANGLRLPDPTLGPMKALDRQIPRGPEDPPLRMARQARPGGDPAPAASQKEVQAAGHMGPAVLTAAEWNAQYPKGTHVSLTLADSEIVWARTKSAAARAGQYEMIEIEGFSGLMLLAWCRPLVLPPLGSNLLPQTVGE